MNINTQSIDYGSPAPTPPPNPPTPFSLPNFPTPLPFSDSPSTPASYPSTPTSLFDVAMGAIAQTNAFLDEYMSNQRAIASTTTTTQSLPSQPSSISTTTRAQASRAASTTIAQRLGISRTTTSQTARVPAAATITNTDLINLIATLPAPPAIATTTQPSNVPITTTTTQPAMVSAVATTATTAPPASISAPKILSENLSIALEALCSNPTKAEYCYNVAENMDEKSISVGKLENGTMFEFAAGTGCKKAFYKQAIICDRNFAPAYNQLARFLPLNERESITEGIELNRQECYLKAIELDPSFGNPYMHLGILLLTSSNVIGTTVTLPDGTIMNSTTLTAKANSLGLTNFHHYC